MYAGLNIWTIGHSTRELQEFIGLLALNKISVLADVRRFPASRKYPHFNQVALCDSLAASGIEYLYFPELGGRRRPRPDSHNTAWRSTSFKGYADHMETDEFRSGVERLAREGSRRPVAIMCSEAVWWRCHRALISDFLKVRRANVQHIMGPGKTEPHPFTSAARIVSGKLSYAAPDQPSEE